MWVCMFTLDSVVRIVLLTMQREDVLKEAELYIFDLFSSMSPNSSTSTRYLPLEFARAILGNGPQNGRNILPRSQSPIQKKVVNVGS